MSWVNVSLVSKVLEKAPSAKLGSGDKAVFVNIVKEMF